MGKYHVVVFLPVGLSVMARTGDTILDVALDNNIPLEHECGGNCACTTCHVILESGEEALSPMQEVEAERLQEAEGRLSASRLACQAILRGEMDRPIMVRIPDAEESQN